MTVSGRTARVAALGAALVGLATMTASAGEIADRAAEAESLVQQGKAADALAAFDKATDALWSAMPFSIRTDVFANTVEGYGRYEPRANATFHSGDKATIYVEPVAYGFAGTDGDITVAFKVGIEVKTAGGLTLARADDMGSVSWHGRTRSRAVHSALNVALPELKPGSYRLAVTLTDAASGKTATAELPFRIAG
jgi:hypothetical protein